MNIPSSSFPLLRFVYLVFGFHERILCLSLGPKSVYEFNLMVGLMFASFYWFIDPCSLVNSSLVGRIPKHGFGTGLS